MFDHAVADSRQLFQLLRLLHHLLDRLGQGIDQFRGFFVAAVTPDDRPVNFQELRRLPQDSCNLFVVHAPIIRGNCVKSRRRFGGTRITAGWEKKSRQGGASLPAV